MDLKDVVSAAVEEHKSWYSEAYDLLHKIQKACSQLNIPSEWSYVDNVKNGDMFFYHYRGIIRLLPGIYAHATVSKVGNYMWVVMLDDKIPPEKEVTEESTVTSFSINTAMEVFYSNLKSRFN
jgi:hypothetical protein